MSKATCFLLHFVRIDSESTLQNLSLVSSRGDKSRAPYMLHKLETRYEFATKAVTIAKQLFLLRFANCQARKRSVSIDMLPSGLVPSLSCITFKLET